MKKVRLTAQEEIDLLPAAKMACHGHTSKEASSALNTIITSVRELIWEIAIKSTKYCPDFVDDAYAEGMKKVFLVLPSFEPGKGRFTTFAGFCAKRHMQRIIENEMKYRKHNYCTPSPEEGFFVYKEVLHSDTYKSLDLKQCISHVSKSDRPYFDVYFGLKNGKTKTLQSTSEELGVSKQRVQQRIKRAIKTIREKELI